MNHILILGAKGMLGSMLSTMFADQHPTLWDRDEIDITNREEMQKKIAELHPTIIINAAAYTNVDGAETDKETAFAVNAHAVGYLAEVAKKIEATLVHYSTDYVFPGTNKVGYTESDKIGPAVNVYGESKLAGEQALQEIKPRYYLLRTAWLYGPNGKNFVDTMLRLAAERSELKIVNDQYGCPTFTKDVAQTTRLLLEGAYEPGIFHVVNEGVTNWCEFAQTIFEVAHKHMILTPISSAEYLLPAVRPAYSVLLNTRGPKLRPWAEALHEYLS